MVQSIARRFERCSFGLSPAGASRASLPGKESKLRRYSAICCRLRQAGRAVACSGAIRILTSGRRCRMGVRRPDLATVRRYSTPPATISRVALTERSTQSETRMAADAAAAREPAFQVLLRDSRLVSLAWLQGSGVSSGGRRHPSLSATSVAGRSSLPKGCRVRGCARRWSCPERCQESDGIALV